MPARDPGSGKRRATSGCAQPRRLLLSCRPLGLRGPGRPPRRSHSCSSCHRICSGRGFPSPVRPALEPQGRPGGTATAGSLLDFHPSCFPALSFPRQPGFGRAWGGRRDWRGCARVGAAEGKSEGGRRRGRAHTPFPGTGLGCAVGLSLPGRQRAPAGELETALASWGFRR